MIQRLRTLLPGIKNTCFLNYAATAPLLAPSAKQMNAIIRQGLEPLSIHFDHYLALIESARIKVATLIGASNNEITFTSNTSTALSLIAASIHWHKHDRVLYLHDEFPSNRYVWQNLSDLGVRAEAVNLAPNENLIDKLNSTDLDKVRLLSLSAVCYLSGCKHDIKRIVEFCHSRNILVVVDAIQAVGATVVDVADWGCDFLACGGQKWLLGPVGCAFLYIRKELLKNLHIATVGWASAADATDFMQDRLIFTDGAKRFEGGLPNVAAIAGLAKSIETLDEISWPLIFKQISDHNRLLRNQLQQLGFQLLFNGENDRWAGIVSAHIDAQQSNLLQQYCHDKNIIITVRNNTFRIAAHAATSNKEIDCLIDGLEKIKNRKIKRAYTPPAIKQTNKTVSIQQWQSALITGASSGLGAGITHALAKRKFRLHLLARDNKKLNTFAAEIEKQYQVAVTTTALDLACLTDVNDWLQQQTQLEFDVLINNAAYANAQRFLNTSHSDMQNALHVNFLTPYLLIKALLPRMLEQGTGGILNILTATSRCALPLFSEYASSKAALWTLGETLSRELAHSGIRVTNFLPPHMASTTAQQLARKAIGFYKFKPTKTYSVMRIAEQAIDALYKNKTVMSSLSNRIKLAFNALYPDHMTRKILKTWIDK